MNIHRVKYLLVVFLILIATTANAKFNWYAGTALTGGGTGALDKISGLILNDTDCAVVVTSSAVYWYQLDDDSAAAESSPDVISPDSDASDKRWLLKNLEYAVPVAWSAYMIALLEETNEANLKAAINLEAGVDFQVYSAYLLAIAALTPTDGNIIVGNGSTWVAESGATARTSLGITTGLPRSYISGLQLSNNAVDSEQDIDIAVGECIDSANAADLVLATGLTKQLDAAFAAGTDAGGLFYESPANNTWYYIFVIKKDSDGTIDAGFDASLTAANIPAGYTEYRRIGSIRTDGSGADIYGFTQIGDTILWDNPKESVDEANVNQTSAALKTLDVPTGIKVKALINVRVEEDHDETLVYLSSPDVDVEAPNQDGAPLASIVVQNSGKSAIAYMEVYTNTSSQIRVRGYQASVNFFDITTLGWIDRRGRDD